MHAALALPEGRSALLLIDLQEEHRQDTRFLVEGFGEVLENAAALLATAREVGMPVIHAAYERDFGKAPLRLHEPVAEGGSPYFSPQGHPFTAICPEVAPRDGEPWVRKNDMSCFSDPEFAGMLEAIAPEWLIVAGVWTEACVGATVRDAMEHGRRVLLVKDACGSGTAAMHQTALMHLANRLYGGAVAITRETIALMCGEERSVWQLSGTTPLRFEAGTIAQVYGTL